VEFDGVDDYVDCGDLDVEGSFTVACWMRPSSFDGWMSVVHKNNRFVFQFNGTELQAGFTYDYCTTIIDTPDVWYHAAVTYDESTGGIELFIGGSSVDTQTGTQGSLIDPLYFGCWLPGEEHFHGIIDDVQIWTRVLTQAEIQDVMTGRPPELAFDPSPANEATDVQREVVLSWTPGESANTHDVYFGTNFDDVNDATTASNVYKNRQDMATFALGRLDFGQTYYWRIDEVNAPPDSTIFKGEVWSFTVEPFAYPIAGENITATASSQTENQGPENTINASGLDVNDLDLHSTEPIEMWLSDPAGPQPTWIQYEFDKVYKLHEMLVWNHNGLMEAMVGIGFKDVTIEYSVNGTDYTTLGTAHEFAQAPGAADYEHNTTVDFGGVPAKFVRLTANSSWVGFLPQYGLSEVRFLYIPVFAREPSPDSGATDVDVVATLSWKAGREAAEHDVYLSTDEQAVIDGTAPVNTVTEASYSTSLDVDSTYYWRVDEVNDAETPTTWQGDIWSFTTPEFLVVDDFESYNDLNPEDPNSNRIFNTWIDGLNDPANGSLVGYDVPPFAEQFLVHGGEQAMPFFYSNTGGATYSEAERTFAVPQDWTKAGVQTLVLYLRADSLSEALDTTFSFTTDGSADWFSQTAISYHDGDAAQSGDISDSQESLMQTTVSGPGTVSFYWKVSSEADWDFLEFYIDGTMPDLISGTVDWQQMTYTITGSGSHTLEWRYMKDEAVSGGEDTGWVDKFEWNGAGQPANMPENTGQLYVKVNEVKLDYPGNVADIEWMKWNIDLADLTSLGVDLQAVTTLAIGIDGDGASGTLYFDDFRLEPGE